MREDVGGALGAPTEGPPINVWVREGFFEEMLF